MNQTDATYEINPIRLKKVSLEWIRWFTRMNQTETYERELFRMNDSLEWIKLLRYDWEPFRM